MSAIRANNSGNITGLNMQGGVIWTAPKFTGTSKGGMLIITNLSIDLTYKRVYASITGNFTGAATGVEGTSGGAITTLDNSICGTSPRCRGSTAWPTFHADMGTGIPGMGLSGLGLTQNGYNHVLSALRLYGSGRTVLSGFQSDGGFGSISPRPPRHLLLRWQRAVSP